MRAMPKQKEDYVLPSASAWRSFGRKKEENNKLPALQRQNMHLFPRRMDAAQEEAAAPVNGDRVAEFDAEAVDLGKLPVLKDLQVAVSRPSHMEISRMSSGTVS